MKHNLDLGLDRLVNVSLTVHKYDNSLGDVIPVSISTLHCGQYTFEGVVEGTFPIQDDNTSFRILPVCARADDRFKITKSLEVFELFYFRLNEMRSVSCLNNPYVQDLWDKVHEVILGIDNCESAGVLWRNTEFGIIHSYRELSNSARTIACMLMDIYGECMFSSLFVGKDAFEKYLPILTKYSNSTLLYDNERLVFMSNEGSECIKQCYCAITKKPITSILDLQLDMESYLEPHFLGEDD